jgi:hypothetical protein
MQGPPEKHLARRQQYFTYILQDVLYHAYQRAVGVRGLPALPSADYGRLFKATVPDVSTRDNNLLAEAAGKMAGAMETLEGLLAGEASEEFKRMAADLVLTFAGEVMEEREVGRLVKQAPSLRQDRAVETCADSQV